MKLGAIKLIEALAEWTDIKRGVRSGCFMSPDLSNLYSDFIMKGGNPSKWQTQNTIHYADNTVLLASSEAGLQVLLNVVQSSKANILVPH